jgi:hypothetical protein
VKVSNKEIKCGETIVRSDKTECFLFHIDTVPAHTVNAPSIFNEEDPTFWGLELLACTDLTWPSDRRVDRLGVE